MNFLILLGWSPGEDREIMTLEEVIKEFDTDRMNPAPAVFDETKLRWMNAHYLRDLPALELWNRVEPFLKEAGLEFSGSDEWKSKVMESFKHKMEVLTDAVELLKPLADNKFKLSEDAMALMKETTQVVEAWLGEIQNESKDFFSEEDFDRIQNKVKSDTGTKGKTLFPPIRVAVVGQTSGLDVKKLIPLLGRDSLIRRAETAVAAGKSNG